MSNNQQQSIASSGNNNNNKPYYTNLNQQFLHTLYNTNTNTDTNNNTDSTDSNTNSDNNNNEFSILSIPLSELSQYAYEIFNSIGLITAMNISTIAFHNYLNTVLLNNYYSINSYHNAHHAVHVLYNTLLYIRPIISKYQLPNIELFSLLLAALNHDIQHCGVNSQYLIQNNDPIVSKYTNKSGITADSIVELHSIDITKQLLLDSNLLINFTDTADIQCINNIITQCIIVTDISITKQHQQLLDQFNSIQSESAEFDSNNDNQRLLLYQLILLSADIGCVCCPLSIELHWCGLLYEEIILKQNYKQYNNNNNTIVNNVIYNSNNNLELNNYQIGQIKFLKYYALKLYNTIIGSNNSILSHLTVYRDELLSNLQSIDNGIFVYQTGKPLTLINK